MKELKLSTGVVQANSYARKIRSVLYAMTKDKLESSKTSKKASEINQFLLKVFREKDIDKDDVVRVRFEFEIKRGELSIDWSTAEIEVYKKERVISGLTGPKE